MHDGAVIYVAQQVSSPQTLNGLNLTLPTAIDHSNAVPLKHYHLHQTTFVYAII
jgi:hypothetical protein